MVEVKSILASDKVVMLIQAIYITEQNSMISKHNEMLMIFCRVYRMFLN